jgi:hypothetical protein
MLVMQRNEVRRHRVVCFLTIVLAAVTLTASIRNFAQVSQLWQIALIVLIGASVVAIVLALLQIYAYPRRSQVLLFQNEQEMILATNALHEGFKLRFLRDILGENVTSFSDEDRAKWASLEADGFYATLYVRNVRKLILLRLCMMIFDDVFVADQKNRWEHHDCANTAEPSFARRETPRLTSWKSSA